MSTHSGATLVSQARAALSRAVQYSWEEARPDGHWIGELKANVTLTAEHIFFLQSLSSLSRGSKGKSIIPDADLYQRYLLHEQQDDGSWAIAPDYPGDVSTSVEAYLALRILGMSIHAPEMEKARHFILQCGGVAKVRVFTRIYLAQFGLFPWDATPEVPAEFILLPLVLPLNIYTIASWARSTIVPLVLVMHHRPVYPLPNGISTNNDFIDELWMDAENKHVPLSGPSLLNPFGADLVAYIFTAVDQGLRWLNGFRNVPLLRTYSRRKCVEWVLERQERAGDWAGIIPPMHLGIQGLLLEGFHLDSDVIQRGLQAIERFLWQDKDGKRLQSCVSPVWDTILMVQGLCDAGVDRHDDRLDMAVEWIKQRQILGPEGDWRIYGPQVTPGGFGFEYHNTWYPDIDDTVAAILSLVRHDPAAVTSEPVLAAIRWVLGMQNKDGGWAGFDKDNNQTWLNKLPVADLNNLCDPSSPDCAGHVIEAFGLVMHTARGIGLHLNPWLEIQMTAACDRAIGYLERTQEATGAWYGRWAVNYVFGTSNVLNGLAYFERDARVRTMQQPAIGWLKMMRNADGGWGESVLSYRDPAQHAGRGPSTPSQTAWALMGLLTTCAPDDADVLAGVSYLLRTQTDVRPNSSAASWPERQYTGTGFPNHFYIGYTLYRHYFPLMALGRFVSASDLESEKRCSDEKLRR